MTKPSPIRMISDLQADELRQKFGLSRSYAFELVKRTRRPSLDLAVQIEREFGVPASAWIEHDNQNTNVTPVPAESQAART